MKITSFYTEQELKTLGLKSFGGNVLISRFAKIYSPNTITIGNNVRIDDFCILSGEITIGNYVHIAAGCYLFAGEYGIVFEDYTGLSSRSVVYATTDDYSGEYMTNPTIPDEYRNVIGGKVIFEKHVLVATGCTILPGVTIAEGTAVGAMSLVNKNLPEWSICFGIPAKKVLDRKKDLLFVNSKSIK